MAEDAAGTEAMPRPGGRASIVKSKGTINFSHVFSRENKQGAIQEFYDLEGVLGEGSYGKVTKGKKKTTKAEFAVKEIFLKKPKDEERFESELRIHSQLDHPNIVKLYEVFRDAKKVYLVMEMCTGGELFDRIVQEAELHEGSAFNEKDAAAYMRQIMRAMVYMHSNEFVHRDIKPENFLLQHKGRDAEIKVIDFGLSKKFNKDPEKKEPMKTKAGTPYYVAPQVLQGKYDEKCDIWSCGVIMYILLCGYPPFYGDRDEDILRRVKKGDFNFPPEDWGTISNKGGAKELIKSMLTLDQEKRPDAAACMAHPWFASMFSADSASSLKPGFAQSLRQFRHTSRLKKVALTLVAQQLQDKEVRDLKATFEAMDTNHDGTLTHKEVVDAMTKHNLQIPEDMAEVIAKIDTDGSGQIEYSEFVAATLTKQQYYKEEVLWSAFRIFDIDCDNFITVEEVETILNSKEVDPELAKHMVAEADKDGDGKINFEEFKEMMGKDELQVVGGA